MVAKEGIYRNRAGIDKTIRGVVKELNQKGYTTIGSCAGHKKSQTGFVTIAPHRSEFKPHEWKSYEVTFHIRQTGESKTPINRTVIKQIFKKHGIVINQYMVEKINDKPSSDLFHWHTFLFKPMEVES